ncbi:hypothetical protein PORCRE_322 [Porphyromonas crevioricanis JCM 15906]|uniref:Uncharacterized protein n=2 Tax=Porphyromonas crevioricanis TaxID=393921 RepID=A0A2X4Q1I9_9PORP|nr:hypothetical protein [Porphyromonas crevioricanis]KGN94163.1 hypothetical protein HQ38_06410 [Porphyromonas crevioricanis]SJZ67718.1 hypothetical protein SAMN02745203_00517 [Porphyromonas crevioricanis]SQH73977.1 Uncharacterised protein [Porphyromonas crevioricanis]GAD04632.1 hypothetical protein PORCRE_322 [Porphyromonas crevioricanis JCM 15906]GAD07211.1 hypothetical protein PORCAN_830 [Porphyromonas crevioricanis JCM 13913]
MKKNAYETMLERKIMAERHRVRALSSLQADYDHFKNNYRHILYSEIGSILIPRDSFLGKIRDLISGPEHRPSPSSQRRRAVGKARPGVEITCESDGLSPIVRQAASMATPILLTAVLGFLKKRIRRKFSRSKR